MQSIATAGAINNATVFPTGMASGHILETTAYHKTEGNRLKEYAKLV